MCLAVQIVDWNIYNFFLSISTAYFIYYFIFNKRVEAINYLAHLPIQIVPVIFQTFHVGIEAVNYDNNLAGSLGGFCFPETVYYFSVKYLTLYFPYKWI